ncbi:MAG TPA: hypothetical protein PLY25_09870 [Bacteroidia bacterium]|nr:hypothetical protein [Bacteroidia bacterium]
MKKLLIIALILCSIGVSAQKLTFSNSKINSISFQVNGIAKTTVIDTVYDTENNVPVRTIKKVYILSDSTKYTESYKAEYNTKKDYWDFKEVNFTKGEVSNNFIIRSNNGLQFGTPNYYIKP